MWYQSRLQATDSSTHCQMNITLCEESPSPSGGRCPTGRMGGLKEHFILNEVLFDPPTHPVGHPPPEVEGR
jgi:hypothetical protein